MYFMSLDKSWIFSSQYGNIQQAITITITNNNNNNNNNNK